MSGRMLVGRCAHGVATAGMVVLTSWKTERQLEAEIADFRGECDELGLLVSVVDGADTVELRRCPECAEPADKIEPAQPALFDLPACKGPADGWAR